jgi:histidine ammonia-lyase
MTVNKAGQMLENLRYVLAIELMSAAQAIDLRGNAELGPTGRATYEAIRSVVSFMADDEVFPQESKQCTNSSLPALCSLR